MPWFLSQSFLLSRQTGILGDVSGKPKDAVERLTRRYDIEAREYHTHWAPILHPLACALVNRLPERGVRRVVDVGAGTGNLLPVLRTRYPGALVVGTDRSPGMLSLAEDHAHVVCSDATAPAFSDGAFDAAVLAFVLFHLEDPVAGLSAVRRMLRPDGVAAVATWAGDLDSPAVAIWNDALDAHGAVSAESLGRLANHEQMDTRAKLEQLMTDAGFAGVDVAREEFVHHLDNGAFIALRTSVGGNRQRFESLDADARALCLSAVRDRLAALPASGLTLRLTVLFATARAS